MYAEVGLTIRNCDSPTPGTNGDVIPGVNGDITMGRIGDIMGIAGALMARPRWANASDGAAPSSRGATPRARDTPNDRMTLSSSFVNLTPPAPGPAATTGGDSAGLPIPLYHAAHEAEQVSHVSAINDAGRPPVRGPERPS